mmetsp:Transcript_14767/g.24506  ORF Transcript_14767/g.24506 Transcript_14767/m.24506 type:complete len:236 (-) Transcript_14767:465-1172(-)
MKSNVNDVSWSISALFALLVAAFASSPSSALTSASPTVAATEEAAIEVATVALGRVVAVDAPFPPFPAARIATVCFSCCCRCFFLVPPVATVVAPAAALLALPTEAALPGGLRMGPKASSSSPCIAVAAPPTTAAVAAILTDFGGVGGSLASAHSAANEVAWRSVQEARGLYDATPLSFTRMVVLSLRTSLMEPFVVVVSRVSYLTSTAEPSGSATRDRTRSPPLLMGTSMPRAC